MLNILRDKIFPLGIVAPLAALSVTTVAASMTGLPLWPFLWCLGIAAAITWVFNQKVGPTLFGPGVGGATILAPLLAFGFFPAMLVVALIGLLQFIIGISGVLKRIHPPKPLKIGITLALGAYLVHKPDVGKLLQTVTEYNPDPRHFIVLVVTLLFVVLALKPMLLNTKIPVKKLSISYILIVGMIGSILTILINHEPTMFDKLKTHEAPSTQEGWYLNLSFYMLAFILCLVELLEGYFNYKSATHITHFEEPPTAPNWAFGISGIMNIFSAFIGAGPVMTGLIKVSVYEENNGQCNRRDLGIYASGIILMSLGSSYILHGFTQWLFAAIVLFVGLKLLVKSFMDMKEVNMSAQFSTLLGAGVVGSIWVLHDYQLVWAILFCCSLVGLQALLKTRSIDEPSMEEMEIADFKNALHNPQVGK